MRAIALLTIAVWLPVAQAADESDPALDYQASRDHPVTYSVDFSVVVTPPYGTKVLKVWLPLPQSDFSQQLESSRLSTFPVRVTPQIAGEATFGNQFAYFEFSDPAGAQVIRHRFKIKVWELRWNVAAERITTPAAWPPEFDVFRRSDGNSVVVDDRFTELVRQIVPEPKNAVHDLRSIMTWVGMNFEYDHAHASLRASSEHALEQRRGHCSDYHGLCASLGRAIGHPTRITYGINTFPKNSPSHCKLEAFLPPYGWVSFDVSETQKLVAAIEQDHLLDPARKQMLIEAARSRLASGFKDNTWFWQTRGTNYDLAPPARDRVAVVRTAYVEADGVPLQDPDPADKNERAFSWMTVHDYRPDKPVTYPFADVRTLEE